MVVGQFLLDVLRGPTLEHALVFVVLLTFIITLYDRYRPMNLARFGPVRRGGPPVGT